MRRREFIGGVLSTAAWPLAARAQQPEQMRRVGVLMNRAADSSEGQARVTAIQQRLQQLGWSNGQNLLIDVRWGAEDPDLERKGAAELAALAPDVVLAGGTLSVIAMLHESRTIPVVFAGVADPVGLGVVASLSHPGGNATGFSSYEYSLAGKLLELLKQMAPGVRRAAILRDSSAPQGIASFAVIQGTAASLHKLPAVYAYRDIVVDGGLVSYAPDWLDQYRRSADYVDRILRGEKPADLPVQAPTKYELVINLKTAKALGIEAPPALLARADEVIE